MFTLAELNESPFKNMVMKLGPFYQLMNFLECIGATMNNFGLSDIIKTIYGSNTNEHMISGKAISRAIHGHMIVDSFLDGMLLSITFKMPFLEETETKAVELSNKMNLNDLQVLHSSISSISRIYSNQFLSNTENVLATQKDNMHDNRTAKLWIQFMNMVAIFKTFIKAE